MISCSKDESTTPNKEFVTTENVTYKIDLPEGITTESAAAWFNQLSEEEIKEYLIEDSDAITTRSCGTWSSWSGWFIEFSGFGCLSRVCPLPQSQSVTVRRRSRVRECASGTEVQTQRIRTTTCRPPC